jgi:hypothetical protein
MAQLSLVFPMRQWPLGVLALIVAVATASFVCSTKAQPGGTGDVVIARDPFSNFPCCVLIGVPVRCCVVDGSPALSPGEQH